MIAASDALFPATSDKEQAFIALFFKYLVMSALFLPWKIIPFYTLFYFLVPKYFPDKPWRIGGLFLVVLLICVVCYRSTMGPITTQFYGDKLPYDVFEWRRIFYSMIEFIPPIALASVVKLFAIYINHRKKLSELNSLKSDMELKLMKAHFNPHFLFNTLNNLYGLARAKNQHTPDYILKLSDIMRSVLDGGQHKFVPLASEIVLIEKYLSLEKLRYDERLHISFNYDSNISGQVAPMSLITFVENAFKHGVSEIANDCFVNINLSVDQNTFVFNIENSISGHHHNPESGILNARKQLQLIYGQDHTLSIEKTAHIYRVSLMIKDFFKYVA